MLVTEILFHQSPNRSHHTICGEIPYSARVPLSKSQDFIFLTNTVDGQNPAPVDRQFIPVFTWFLFIPGG